VRYRPLALAVVLVVFLCSGVAVTATTAEPTMTATAEGNATLVGAYPNPVAEDDRGEFVTVRFEHPTNTTGWALGDGTTAVQLPNRTFRGTVAFTSTPEAARNHTETHVVELDGRLRLANGGEGLVLRAGEERVDTARYRDAPESRIRSFQTGTWRPIGATDIDPISARESEVTAFTLPDSPTQVVETLRGADDRLLLGGYTLTSERVTDLLVDAHERGVTVRVLLDGSPVGGMSERQAEQLTRLSEAGVDVQLLDGPHTRYAHHHPKYAVVDDRALVLTENFKPAGTGGMSSRGWGVVLSDAELASALADLHAADRTWRAATPWSTYRRGRDFVAADPAVGDFETRHHPKQATIDAATLLVAPDNAASAVERRIDRAETRVLVQQVEIDSRENRLLRAAIRAADRGVRVRIQLSSGWYVGEENAALVEWLNRRADAEGWDLDARVDDPDGYRKIHTKGVIVDDTAILGSLNWGRTAMSENREVAVALDGESVADYYAGVFDDDWSGSNRRKTPAGLFGVAAVAIAGALLFARRIQFRGRDGVVTDWQW
jgi:cardiolipin synthase